MEHLQSCTARSHFKGNFRCPDRETIEQKNYYCLSRLKSLLAFFVLIEMQTICSDYPLLFFYPITFYSSNIYIYNFVFLFFSNSFDIKVKIVKAQLLKNKMKIVVRRRRRRSKRSLVEAGVGNKSAGWFGTPIELNILVRY